MALEGAIARSDAACMAVRRNATQSDGDLPMSLHRLLNFSDAVFAIAATLLVIDLRPPQTSSDVYEEALQAYLRNPGPFIATTIGFLVVGSFWSSHRRIFTLVRDTSGGLVWANLLFLFGVAIQPFLTAALAEHDPNRTSVLLYACGQIGTCAAQLALWAVVLRRPALQGTAATERRRRYVTLQLLRAPLVFALSIPVLFIAGPGPAMASWGLMVVLAIIVTAWFADLRPQAARRTA
jgi:TMEM175 potassium channel family protein